MKKLFGSLIIALSAIAAPLLVAAENATATFNVMRIDRADGVTERLRLHPDLVVKFADNAIFLIHPEITVEYPIDDLSSFTYENAVNPGLYDGTHESASISEVESDVKTITVTADEISVAGADPILLYDLRGVMKARGESDGTTATLSTSGLPAGIYIVRCGTLTLKLSL